MPGSGTQLRTRASNCALLTISVICMCVLVVCGVMIVREYSLATGYKPSICTVEDVKLSIPEIPCTFCGTTYKDGARKKGACQTSSFPCYEVVVRFEGRTGVLHPDSIQAAGKHPQCSFETCQKTLQENQKLVDVYLQQYRNKKEEFKCYYNTDNPHELIAKKKHTTSDVIHSMLWPSLIILVCGAIFLRLEMKRRGLTFCASGLPEPIGYIGEAKLAGNTQKNSGKQPMIAKYNMSSDPKVEHKVGGLPAACPLLRQQDNGKLISSSLSSLDRLAKHNDPRLLQTKAGVSGSHTHINRLTPEPWKPHTTGSVDKIKDSANVSQKPSKDATTGKQGGKASPAIPKVQVRGPNERTDSLESQGSSKSIRAETPV